MKKKFNQQNLVAQAYHNPKYEGKHIIVIGGKIYATKTGMAQVELLDKLMKKYPKEKPSIAYIPDSETLIPLLLGREGCLNDLEVCLFAFNTIISSRI